MTKYGEGDRVQFVNWDGRMNSDLERLEGDTGTVVSIRDGKYESNLKAFVDFDISRTKAVWEKWWINVNRLEKIEEEK